jgi:hypothetical protein
MSTVVEPGRYVRRSTRQSVWVIEVLPDGRLKVRRPKGAFTEVKIISPNGFLTRHEKAQDGV